MNLLERLENVSFTEALYVYHTNKASNVEVDPYKDKAISYLKASGCLFEDLLRMGCGVESRIFKTSSESDNVAIVTRIKFGFRGCSFTVRLWFDFFHPDLIQVQYPTGGGKTDKDWKNVISFKEVAYALACYLNDDLKLNQKAVSRIPLLHFSPRLQGNMAKYYYRKGV